MMIDPKNYIETMEDEPLEELLKERDNFIKNMHKFENNEIDEEEYCIDPSPDVEYIVSFSYLSELCNLIHKKIVEKNRGF